MSARVNFTWRVGVAMRDDLLQICRKKGSYRTGGFILMHVAKFVAQQTRIFFMAAADEHGVP